MKKNNITKRIKVKADLQTLSDESESYSDEKENQKKENKTELLMENENIYRCPKCFNIPLINVKDNENKVIIDCLKGHHTEMLFSEYMTPEFQNNIYKLECSQCGNEKNMKKSIKICYECQNILCKDCLSFHNKNNPNHHINSIDNIDINCPLHKSKYTKYCFDCKLNLCDECSNNKEYKHINHQIIIFKNIILKNNELNDIKYNLEKENEILLKIKKIFNDTLTALSNKFNDIISYKFLCLKYKNNIINTYETKEFNYQIIDNINHLKFINKNLKIEPEMNELDIIYELFNFLDSIEYNDEDNNTNNNNEAIDYMNFDYRLNINENNKLSYDSKNKIEESENEDDNEKKKIKENKEENLKKENKIINDDQYEKNNEDNINKDDFNKKQDIKKNYIKINENFENNNQDIKNINENIDKENFNENIQQKDLGNQIKEEENSNIIKENKSINHNILIIDETKDDLPNNNLDKFNIDENKDKKENNEEENENSNDNEENIYIYKSNRHIPVNTEYNKEEKKENFLEEEIKKNEKELTEDNKDKGQKKKKKKIIKKKKNKIVIKKDNKNEEDTKKNNDIKSEIINKTKDNEKKEEKEDLKNYFDKINNNIELNENDSKEIINYNNKVKKEDIVEKNNENINIEEEQEISQDILSSDNNLNDKINGEIINNISISNQFKEEEPIINNNEELKGNKVPKKTKAIKKKKKKKLNIIKIEQNKDLNNAIDSESNNPINEIQKESISKNNYNFKDEKDNSNIDENKENLNIGENIESINKSINTEEDNKSKESKVSHKNNKRSTVNKKLNFGVSDKEEIEENSNEKNDFNNISEIQNNSFDIKSKLNKYNNEMNLNLPLNEKIDSNFKSPMIKKRKKIKKKKYLINVDDKGNIKPEIKEKQIKITKKTTLIRSKSKDKPKERKISQDTFDSNLSNDKVKNKEINFKIYKNDGENSSNYNNDNDNSSTNTKKEINNIKKINKINPDLGAKFKENHNRKIRMVQGKNNAALLFENSEELYLQEKSIKRVKRNGLNKLEKEIDRRNLNLSVDNCKNRAYKNRKLNNEYNYDEIKYLMERSNSYKKLKKYKKFSEREKINCIKFENGISCLLEINSEVFAIGNLIGDIIINNYHTYKQIQVIREHDGTIISLYLLKDKSILSCSADRKMLKIRLNESCSKYDIEFVFHGYENYILKAIELMNTFKIITCSWDDRLFLWEKINESNYRNTLTFNEGERVVDLLEINSNCFVSISESNELKIWNSNNYEIIDSIKNIKGIGSPNALCKINDIILCVLDYHEIQLIDITSHKLINKINFDDGNLSCMIKLNDNSILLAEDYNNDKYCVFYIKQFYYEEKDLKPISNKKDKFYKTNKNNDKEIRALIQFSNGVIVQGITGEYNGKDSGDLFFYY